MEFSCHNHPLKLMITLHYLRTPLRPNMGRTKVYRETGNKQNPGVGFYDLRNSISYPNNK